MGAIVKVEATLWKNLLSKKIYSLIAILDSNSADIKLFAETLNRNSKTNPLLFVVDLTIRKNQGQLEKTVKVPCLHLVRLQLCVSGLVVMIPHLPWLPWPFVHCVLLSEINIKSITRKYNISLYASIYSGINLIIKTPPKWNRSTHEFNNYMNEKAHQKFDAGR